MPLDSALFAFDLAIWKMQQKYNERAYENATDAPLNTLVSLIMLTKAAGNSG